MDLYSLWIFLEHIYHSTKLVMMGGFGNDHTLDLIMYNIMLIGIGATAREIYVEFIKPLRKYEERNKHLL